jgi:hypothetical protein
MTTIRKLLLLLAAVALLALPAAAQNTTTVTATVTDPSGIPYSNATVQAQLLPSGITPTDPPPCNGQNVTPCVVSAFQRGSTSSTGAFSMNLASNAVLSPGGTTWQITVNTVGAAPPLGTGSQTCSATLTISGASQVITSSFSGVACPSLSNLVNSASKFDTNGVYTSTSSCQGLTNCFQIFGDGQFVGDAVYTASSSTVTTSGGDPSFACPGSVYPCSTPGPGSDAGKVVFGTTACLDGTVGPCTRNLPQGTITTVNSAHSITASTTAIANSSLKSPLIWCHDDGAQVAAAFAQTIANATNGPSANLFLTCGIVCVGTSPFIIASGNKFSAIGVNGCGGGGTTMVPLPLMNCTGGANTGCLISDVEHVETGQEAEPAAHFRDITFYGGGTDVKDPAATVTANTSGIRITFFDLLTNVWITGWMWGSATNLPGITNAGGTMIDSGTYAGGSPACVLQGNSNTVATMHGGSCGGSKGDSIFITSSTTGGVGTHSQTSTEGVYVNGPNGVVGTGSTVHNSGGMWSDHGSFVGSYLNSDNANSLSYLNGTQLNQIGGGNSTLTVSAGNVYLNQTNLQATGPAINQSGGAIFDDCGNSISDLTTVNPVVTNLFGSCSVTGIADVAGNHVLTSGWGTANVNTVSGSTNDVFFTISVTGGAPAANPVLTDTFASQYWATPNPGCTLTQIGGTFAVITNPIASSLSRTGVTWTFSGTPVSGQSYKFSRHCSNS